MNQAFWPMLWAAGFSFCFVWSSEWNKVGIVLSVYYNGVTNCPSLQMSLTVNRSQLWETSLARFLILLINNNPAKCCHLIFIDTCLFSNGLFYDRRRLLPQPTLALSPSLSLSLSATLSSCPLFRFDRKLIESRVKIINWISAFW
jgi:hypothetical protein